ncbi:MAG: ABC transporter permease [Spirochaetaceae bacterium]
MNRLSALFLALRYLFGSRRSSSSRIRSAVWGIGLSLIPLVLVLEISDGMIRGITDRFLETSTYHLQAIHVGGGTPEAEGSLRRRIEEVPGVVHAWPERQGIALASASRGRVGVTVRAVAPEMYAQDQGFARYLTVESGDFDLSGERGVVIGRAVADRLDVRAGDELRILTIRGRAGERVIPRVSTFTVRGVVSVGYQELDRLWVFISHAEGVRILPDDSSRDLLGIKITSPYALENPLTAPTGTNETRLLRGRIRDAATGTWRVLSWYDLEESRYVSFRTTKSLLGFIMALIVVVAAVNVSSSLVVVVLEKQSEIAILKATGARPGWVRDAFLYAGLIAGALGAALGVALGILLTMNINQVLTILDRLGTAVQRVALWIASPFLDGGVEPVDILPRDFYLETIPISLNPGQLAAVWAFAAIVAVLAAVIPARRAARLKPLEVMRRH